MHMMKTYENLRDMLDREVTEIEKRGNLDAQSLDHLYKLMATIKYTDKCIDREQGNTYGMSYNSMPMDSFGYGGNNFRHSSYRGGSYEPYYGISREDSRQKMRSRLEMLMNEATNENERQAIMDAMNKM